MSLALGKIDFSDTPTVAGANVLTALTLPNELTNLAIPGTEGVTIPKGTTAQRPAGTAGQMRWNTTLNQPEVHTGTTWITFARVIQSAAGVISATSSAYNLSATTAAPASNQGALLFTQSFTPLVVGSNIVIQYVVTATASTTAARNVYTAAFADTVCVGMAAGNAPGSGYCNLSLQCLYTTTSTNTITFTGRSGNLGNATTTNYNTGFASALVTEYRILEMI